jgi:hypothetical protein
MSCLCLHLLETAVEAGKTSEERHIVKGVACLLSARFSFSAIKTQYLNVPNIAWLILFGEIIAVSFLNRMKPTNASCGKNAELLCVKLEGTYGYRWALKG